MTKQTANRIHFSKMHGLGNDFVVMNTIHQAIDLATLPIKQLGDRHFGIGFDQLLLIEPSKQADFFCRIFNTDGSEAEQCGNGLRCVARYLREEGLHHAAKVSIETKAGIFKITIKNNDHIAVSMGVPCIESNKTLLSLPSSTTKIALHVVSMGNPHAIIHTDAIDILTVAKHGKEISTHQHFPAGINVGFMRIINPHHIELRTYERGAGITHACGSNACAAVAAGIATGLLQQSVDVDYQYGRLHVEWDDINKPIILSGPATTVYSGVFSF